MPQSHSAMYAHLVFSTKQRYPFIRDENVRNCLHAYVGGICKNLECPPIRVGGTDDHIHVLARLGRTITQAEWVKETKRISHQWIKTQGRPFEKFQWQGGYAAFSVSQSNLEAVADYVATQAEHHRRVSFQDELRALLRRHNIEFDERFVWD